jgi:toxin ParE1/3/4
MNFNYSLTIQAETDIENIWFYIAQDNLNAANKMVDRFYEAFSLLADNPEMGRKRPDLTDADVYFFNVQPRYRVIYRLDDDLRLTIAGVVTAEQDIASFGVDYWQ